MFGYRIGDGLSTFAYISDHGPIDAGPGPEGLGEYHPAIMDLADGVDLLIHDAQYTVDEFAARSHFGHSAVDYTVKLGLKAGVKKLLLFHHDPSHSDDQVDLILAHAAGLRGDAAMEIESAAEGGQIDLG